MGLKRMAAGFLRWARWLTARESLDSLAPGRGPGTEPDSATFMARLFGRERLPEDERREGRPPRRDIFLRRILEHEPLGLADRAAEPPPRASLFGWIAAGESLGEAGAGTEPDRETWWGWLAGRERLPEDAAGAGSAGRPTGFIRRILAREELGQAERPAPPSSPRPSLLRWLLSGESLDKSGTASTNGVRRS